VPGVFRAIRSISVSSISCDGIAHPSVAREDG
jgi:hypothetical protein